MKRRNGQKREKWIPPTYGLDFKSFKDNKLCLGQREFSSLCNVRVFLYGPIGNLFVLDLVAEGKG